MRLLPTAGLIAIVMLEKRLTHPRKGATHLRYRSFQAHEDLGMKLLIYPA